MVCGPVAPAAMVPDVQRATGQAAPTLQAQGATPWRIDAFLAGYRGAGGAANYEAHIVEDVIPCEYGWEPWQPGNGYLSRAQFDPQSWETAGGGDPADDYTVGANMARWMAMVDPGSSAGWPVCWWIKK